MSDPAAFTDPENWNGGFYELSVELGGSTEEHLERALAGLWQAAGVQGSYARPDREPGDQDEVGCTVASLRAFGHLRGTVQLPGGRRVVCGALAIGADEPGEPDWLVFYLPVGALGRADRRVGAFPFGASGGRASLAWHRPIDDWLAAVAQRVHRAAGLRLALIGFEQAGQTSASRLHGTVPAQRPSGYLLPAGAHLRYHPATR